MRGAPHFVDEHLLRIGTLEFHCEHPIGHVPPGRLPVEKPRDLVRGYLEACGELGPTRIVELGIFKGGSTALLSELARPEKLVALELTEDPVRLLDDFIAERGFASAVRPFYGVDQSDRVRVAEIMQAEFSGSPIDLVIDDASHLYAESLASFEVLFPLVRPGGLFLLEDWRWQHQVLEAVAVQFEHPTEEALTAIAEKMDDVAVGRAERVVPMSRLAVELVLARAASGDAVSEVTIGPYWAAVRRGPGSLDRTTFKVADIVRDHFNLLAPIP